MKGDTFIVDRPQEDDKGGGVWIWPRPFGCATMRLVRFGVDLQTTTAGACRPQPILRPRPGRIERDYRRSN
jgi:hypothetical protein